MGQRARGISSSVHILNSWPFLRVGFLTPTVGSALTCCASSPKASRKFRAYTGVAARRSRPLTIDAWVMDLNGSDPAVFSTCLKWFSRLRRVASDRAVQVVVFPAVVFPSLFGCSPANASRADNIMKTRLSRREVYHFSTAVRMILGSDKPVRGMHHLENPLFVRFGEPTFCSLESDRRSVIGPRPALTGRLPGAVSPHAKRAGTTQSVMTRILFADE